MESPLSPKRICSAQLSDPLSDAGILEQVLGYAGPGVWLYIGAVSTLWKQCYEKVTLDQLRQDAIDGADIGFVSEAPHETWYRTAFASVATLTWAYTSALTVDVPRIRQLQFAASRHASMLVLAVAHELGMPMSAKVFAGE